MAEEMAKGKMSAEMMRPIIGVIPAAIEKAWPNRPRPRKGWHIWQDNDTGQTAASLQPDYKAQSLRNFKAPGNAGDLRFYECWWTGMRTRLFKEDPGRGETLAQFKARVKKTILKTPKKELGKFGGATSMRRRLEDCVRNAGGRVRG